MTRTEKTIIDSQGRKKTEITEAVSDGPGRTEMRTLTGGGGGGAKKSNKALKHYK